MCNWWMTAKELLLGRIALKAAPFVEEIKKHIHPKPDKPRLSRSTGSSADGPRGLFKDTADLFDFSIR
ncbi:hypothetical protein J21TS7_17390 [Paenibacillus cineris]|uniref:Uncharacterized protein n=1 Tax=Paenibacillus cineris TaxID=237530 RepID=A0ABQ4LAK0_9BACL|nr:hypothetical protein J21TS7_17390 [Paenibacillus cineris]